MPPLSSRRNLFPWAAAAAYLALLAVYFLYWRHAEWFVDDWFLMPHFRQASQQGFQGVLDFAADAAKNNIYGVFRMQWLSILYGYAVTALGGYSPRFNFAVLLALHGVCCWLLCQALWRLGVERGLAFLAGAFYLLSPAVHFSLFTYFTNPFFVFSTFWVLLLLWWFAGQENRLSWRNILPAVGFAVAGMFSGEQSFLLLWILLPLAALCFSRRRSLFRIVVPVWAALGIAGGAYLLRVNRAAVWHAGFGKRYEWSWSQI